jgi:uncharacterized MAPEG superfamily protein
MARSHTHWPDGKGPVCKFATKAECNANWREYVRQLKEDYERARAARAEEEHARQIETFDAFIASEQARMEAACRKTDDAV